METSEIVGLAILLCAMGAGLGYYGAKLFFGL
jgi:hypothetical protein